MLSGGLLLSNLVLLHLLLHQLRLGLGEPVDPKVLLAEVRGLLRRHLRLGLRAGSILNALLVHHMCRNAELLLTDRLQAIHCLVDN